ncbi:hypothetical protein [Enterobacter asburiae]|uniref:hypothetical protein n=1 Tax=Enterobacter asburiae TaxID=61645 RepID=UPI003F57CA7D
MLSTLVVLTGSVDTRWVKPGASDHDRQVQLTVCEAQSLKDLPPDNVVENSYSRSSLKDKLADKKIDQNKEIRNWVTDANASKRDILVKDCMFHNGWSQVEVNQ